MAPDSCAFRDELKTLLIEKSLEFKKVTLASGKTSDYYLDCKRVTLHPRGLYLISKIFWQQLLHGNFPEAVGGPTLGADPLTAGLILLSAQEQKPLIGLIIRKEPKEHGTGVWIEGLENTRPAMNVALLEDVVTTAASSLRSIEKVKAAGLRVSRVLCVVDREEGGVEALRSAGYRLEAIFQATELKETARRGKR